jgi:phosphate:Na+ symporter
MLYHIGLFVSGIGFFFFGLHLVTTHLQQSGGHSLRALLARVTDRTWLSCLLGIVAGAVTQSASAISAILASMTASGIVSARRALPILAWTNVGTTLLIFLSLLDVRLAILFLLGLSAIAFSYSRQASWRTWFGVVLGVCLLFYGLDGMKVAGREFQNLEWFHDLWAQARHAFLLAFLGGLVLAFLTQSTNAVILLGLGMAQNGLLSSESTMTLIYGAHVGTTFTHLLLDSGVKGSARQVRRFQDLFKVTGSTVFMCLFYLEVWAGVPLVHALVAFLSDSVETQMALVNLSYNVSMALAFTLLLDPTVRLLNRLWPATAEESFSKPQFLDNAVLDFPETALDLVEKEQARLLSRLHEFLALFTLPSPTMDFRKVSELHRAFATLAGEIEQYCAALIDRGHSQATSERLTNIQSRQSLIEFLEEALFNLVTTVRQTPPSPQLKPLVLNFAEALDFLLCTASEAAGSLDVEEARLLVQLSGDRGDLMSKIRSWYLSAERDLGQADKMLLLRLTALFERIVWMVKRLGRLLAKENIRSADSPSLSWQGSKPAMEDSTASDGE